MKGPKTLLAEAISGFLDEFFIVDQIESQLLLDAAVKLHNAELRPRDNIAISSTTVASVHGVVQYVAFEWHWGKSEKEGGSDLVKDVTLTLKGLDFTVTLETKDVSEVGAVGEVSKATEDALGEPKKAASSIMLYFQAQIERIMDTLTLAINDVHLTIVLPDGSKLEVGSTRVEISSNGRQVGLPLLQELDIQRLHANITSKDGESVPFFEDISYKAATERKFGSRFLSRFDRGMEVMGESSDNGFVLHAGETQIQVIGSLIGLLAQAPLPSPPVFETEEGVKVNSEGSMLSDGSETDDKEKDGEGLPTYIQLPLAGVSLTLPNEAKIALSNIVLKYQLDGSVFSVEGKQGITVDDLPFFALGETTIWIADLATSEFRVEDTAVTDQAAGDEVVAYLRANSSEFSRLSGGVTEALGIHQRVYEMQDMALPPTPKSEIVTTKDKETSTSWKLHLPGVIGCLWEHEGSDIEVEMCNVEARLDTMSMNVASISKFQYAGTLQLADPIENSTFAYDGFAVSATLQDVVVVLAEKEEDTDASADAGTTKELGHASSSMDLTDSSEDSSGYVLPFGMHLVLHKFLAFKPDAKSVHTTLEKLELKMDPVSTETDHNDNRTCVAIRVGEVNHDMLRLKESVFKSTFVLLSDWDPISSFHFGANEIYVAAGYSLRDWAALLPKKKAKQIQKKPLNLPYAHVDKVKVIAIVKGIIGVKDSVLQVGKFDGKENTTSADLISFYSAKATSQIPGMIVDAQVLGTSVGDNVVSTYGGALLGNLVGGAGVGGLLSVAAFDGVRNTINEGKVGRGVENTDAWKFSDIARGLQHAAARATREGATKRGKGEAETGDAVDWVIGASDDAKAYTEENKGRLAGAGAGAIGFGWGLAFGGPLGAVVGTVMASAATQKTVETIDDAIKTKGIEGAFTVHDVNNPTEIEPGTKESLLSGILLKRRDLVKWDWRPHYFVLSSSSLKYYVLSDKTPKGYKRKETDLFVDTSEGPRKSLDFLNHYIGKDGNLSRPEKSLFVFSIFSLESEDPLWTLAATSEESRDRWISAVSEVMASDGGNDVRRSRVCLRTSAKRIDSTRRESVRHSLPPELRDLIE